MPLGIRAEWLGCLAQRWHGAASSAEGPVGSRVNGAANCLGVLAQKARIVEAGSGDGVGAAEIELPQLWLRS